MQANPFYHFSEWYSALNCKHLLRACTRKSRRLYGVLSRSPCPVNTSVNAWLIFVVKMAIVAFVVSVFVISVSCMLGVSFTAFTIYSIYLFYVHWKYSHIPGPKRDSFFFGNIPLIRRERERGRIMHELMQDLHSVHGPVVLMFAFHSPFLFVSDPEITRKLLVTLNLPKNPRVYAHLGYPFGHRVGGAGLVTEVDHGVWQKRRALLNPAFHRRYLMNLMEAFNSSCDLFLAKVDELADGKTVVNMADLRIPSQECGIVVGGEYAPASDCPFFGSASFLPEQF